MWGGEEYPLCGVCAGTCELLGMCVFAAFEFPWVCDAYIQTGQGCHARRMNMRACRLFFHLLNDSTFRNRKYKRSKNDLNSRMMARAGTIVTLCTHEVLTSSTTVDIPQAMAEGSEDP